MRKEIDVPARPTVAVVYEGKTGSIRHVHEEVTLPGGTPGDPEKLEERALGIARSLAEEEIESPKVLILKKGQRVDFGQPYRVDPEKRRLVRIRRAPAEP